MSEYRFAVSTPEELKEMLSDENCIKEYANYIVLEHMNKREAWIKTFRPDTPMTGAMEARMYRWFNKDVVKKWITKANKSLEVDWIDKKVDILERMYKIATDTLTTLDGEKVEVSVKQQASTGKDWLDAVKADKTLKIDMGDNTTINIVQIMQDKLNLITDGSVIQPDKPKFIEAEVE